MTDLQLQLQLQVRLQPPRALTVAATVITVTVTVAAAVTVIVTAAVPATATDAQIYRDKNDWGRSHPHLLVLRHPPLAGCETWWHRLVPSPKSQVPRQGGEPVAAVGMSVFSKTSQGVGAKGFLF